MLNLEPKIIVFDTEFTSWEEAQERKWSGPNEYKEIVEIGAVLVDTSNFSEIDSFKVFIKPVKNPKLSEYFISLTGITQEKLNKEGIDLTTALNKFSKWSDSYNLYSWGKDEKTIMENCNLIKIKFPMNKEIFFDARDIFSAHGIKTDGYMSSTIIKAFHKKLIRRSRDSLNDARSIVDALRELVKARAKNAPH